MANPDLAREAADLLSIADKSRSRSLGELAALASRQVPACSGATATLSYPFTTRMNGEVSGYYRKTETTGIGGGQSISGGPNIGSNSSDVNEYVGAAATLRMGLLRWLSLTLTYTYTHRFDNGNTATNGSSDNFNAGYTENRVRLGFDIKF